MMNRRLLANVIIALLMVTSLSVLVAYGLPIVLKSKILALIEQETGKKASLSKIQFALSPLTIQLQNFVLQETNGKPFASFDNFSVQVNTRQSVKNLALVIDNITLLKPIVRIAKQKDGTLNVDTLFNKKVTDEQTRLNFPISITKLSLADGTLTWEDNAVKENILPINLTIDNLSTAANQKYQLLLQLALNSGGQLHWQGEVRLNPFFSKGRIQLNHIKLQRLLALSVPTALPFNLAGYALVDSDYQASYSDKKFTFTSDKTQIGLRDFQYRDQDFVAKTPDFNHQTDVKIHYANDSWSFIANKSKISLRDFEFSDLSAAKTIIKIPRFSHETDIKISSTQRDWSFIGTQSKITASNVQFSAPTTNLAIKSATLNHDSDFHAKFIKNNWQFSSTKNKITSHDLQLAYANTTLKILTIALETGLDLNGAQIITQQGKLTSDHAQLFDKNQQQPLFEILTLALNGVDFNLNNQALTLDSIQVDGADFQTWIDARGQFNYQTLFTPAKIPASIEPTKAKTTPWAINVNTITLTHIGTTFEDRTLKKPVLVTLKPIDFKLTGYSNKTGVKLPFQLNAGINKTGSIQINGDTTLEPFTAQLTVNAHAIALESLQPYLEKVARLDLIDGQFALDGKFAIALPDNKPLDLKFIGNTSISQLITRDQKRHKNFITWKTLTLKALAIDLQKDRYIADALIIDKPYARVIIKKDKTVNFSDIFITESQDASKATAKREPYFKLNKVQIIDGSSDFADRSLILPFAAEIKSLDGGASDMSSEKKSNVKVSLKGIAYDLSPVDIDGNISPYLGNYDLTVNFKGMPMPLISPYMVEFAGYKVEKGKMSLKLKYKVVDGELSVGSNILIDQFELGEKVENPRAVSLPLEFAVALLKDSDGKIKIDVPITGSLNDPKFNIGALITDALVNAISKIISSPFRALASLVDDDEDLSTINFSAGNAVLNKAEKEKLTALAKILKQRSVLVLDIKGTAFQTQDWPALREAALYDQLKKIRADELNKQSDTKILPEYVELSTSDYQRLLAELFIEKFPTLAKKSFFGKPELIDAKAGDFYQVAKQQLMTTLKREQPRLKELATQRARAIANYLVKENGVSNEQVFILDTAIDPQTDNNEISSLLSLKTN